MMQRGELHSEPLQWLHRWFTEATEAGVYQPDAMALATVGAGGMPSVRMVLLKRYGDDGLLFFTNYFSRKGVELEVNAQVSGTLWWGPQERAVRFEGTAAPCDDAVSDEYFASRPRGSRVAAIVSPQSQPLGAYDQLQRASAAMQQELGDAEPQRPDFWGGYVIVPSVFEFWQGMPDRLHQRHRYELVDGVWSQELLAP